jgi:hypothetical protein
MIVNYLPLNFKKTSLEKKSEVLFNFSKILYTKRSNRSTVNPLIRGKLIYCEKKVILLLTSFERFCKIKIAQTAQMGFVRTDKFLILREGEI